MTQDRIYAFVEENMKTIFAYACSRVPHKQEAEDLAGDIIAALLAAAGRIRSEEALFGYVWTIAANTYKKYLRRKSRCAAERFSDTAAFFVCGCDLPLFFTSHNVKGTEEQLYMGIQLFKAFSFPFRLAVADTQ